MSGTWQILLGGEWLTHATELLLDIRLGKVEARPLAITLMRYLLAEQHIQQMESDLAMLITKNQAAPASNPTRPSPSPELSM